MPLNKGPKGVFHPSLAGEPLSSLREAEIEAIGLRDVGHWLAAFQADILG